jgi:hypothetical protein
VLGGSHFLDKHLQGFHSDSQSENRRFIVLVGYDCTHSCLVILDFPLQSRRYVFQWPQ